MITCPNCDAQTTVDIDCPGCGKSYSAAIAARHNRVHAQRVAERYADDKFLEDCGIDPTN